MREGRHRQDTVTPITALKGSTTKNVCNRR